MRPWVCGLLSVFVAMTSECAIGAEGTLEQIQMPPRPRCVDGSPKYFEESCTYLNRRDAVAAADAHAPKDALYGIYEFHTGTVGAELALDRDGWAGFHQSSDAGVSIPGVGGSYRVSDDTLVVDLEPGLGRNTSPTRLEYRIVRWGTHVFLLTPEQLTWTLATLNRDGLLHAVHDLNWDMQRQRNRKDPLCGSPQLSGEWRRYLHPHPLHVTLLDAQPDPAPKYAAMHAREYLIQIDAGRAQGLFPGMYVKGEPSDSAHLNVYGKIERVDDRRAWGTLAVMPVLTTDSADSLVVGKGTHLTTGDGWDPAACVPTH